MISEPMECSAQNVHLSCVKISTISMWNKNKHPLEPRHQGVPSGASKTISKPMVHLVQTMHLCCTDTNFVSKWTETSPHMTQITKEFHRVCRKWFLSLWYVWCKPCTYLASRLALSPNGLNQASTWALLRTAIGYIQNDFWAYVTFGANRAPISHWH
jgi:hypothetical protein